jgi:hypothetical protein
VELAEVATLIAGFVMLLIETTRVGENYTSRWLAGGPWLDSEDNKHPLIDHQP